MEEHDRADEGADRAGVGRAGGARVKGGRSGRRKPRATRHCLEGTDEASAEDGMTRLEEVRDTGRMAWADQHRGWLASPEDIGDALISEGFEEYKRRTG